MNVLLRINDKLVKIYTCRYFIFSIAGLFMLFTILSITISLLSAKSVGTIYEIYSLVFFFLSGIFCLWSFYLFTFISCKIGFTSLRMIMSLITGGYFIIFCINLLWIFPIAH